MRQFLLSKMIILGSEDIELRSNFVKHLNSMARHGVDWFRVYEEENAGLTHDDVYADPEMDNQTLPGLSSENKYNTKI